MAMSVPLGNDAHFFEESIHPNSIRLSLANADPSSSASTPALVKGMKWLLAMMSKGRDLSDFFPEVVKLVGAQSLEARKLVYMYLVHYADHDDTCRELALLSINSFQRGLADNEQLIRALALRVMSSIRVTDILQIQILAVQKCSKDPSPYVRKCAANALSKLHAQCSITEQTLLKDLLKDMLTEDGSTMVLTSAIIAFWELYPGEYQMLHGSYRKLCHLLTDMDEWGQVIAMDCLANYCRRSFRKPSGGSGELVDKERRLKRPTNKGSNGSKIENFGIAEITGSGTTNTKSKTEPSAKNTAIQNSTNSRAFSNSGIPKKVKRRVVRKAFYSDEEDESSVEEVYTSSIDGKPLTLAAALRQRNVEEPIAQNNFTEAAVDDEDEDLDPDHKLLLRSSLPLLKSRNSAVVLAVCSLHYYCGVSSIKIRTALGKALVRIHRDRREIQYVVLTSIRELVEECPSAFTPFLTDFFVKAMDPSFTRMIKLEILTNLALEPKSIMDILRELRSYVRHDDKQFVCASIKAIGRITEIARIVYERVMPDPEMARKESDKTSLNCLHGLIALTRCSKNEEVIGECVVVTTFIMGQLIDTSINDPNDVRGSVISRLLFLMTRSLLFFDKEDDEESEENERDENTEKWYESSEKDVLCLSINAMASSLWLIGEWFTSSNFINILPTDPTKKAKINGEILRLLSRLFPDFEPLIKLHAIHYSSKILLCGDSSQSVLCSHILSQGRLDVNPDVRDRARYESALLSLLIPSLLSDLDTSDTKPSISYLSSDEAKTLLLSRKPPSSTLPIDHGIKAEKEEKFRFGTISSLLHHRAGKAYLPLPPWAESDSDKSLRDPPVLDKNDSDMKNTRQTGDSVRGFYDDEYNSDDSDDQDSSDSESSYESTDEDEYSESTSDEESSEGSDEDDSDEEEITATKSNGGIHNLRLHASTKKSIVDDSSEEESSADDDINNDTDDETDDDTDDETDDDEDDETEDSSLEEEKSMQMNSMNDLYSNPNNDLLPISSNNMSSIQKATNESVDDLSGLVMAPLVVDVKDSSPADMNTDSGRWYRLIRPELAGGLSLEARYVQGASRKRELNVAGQEVGDGVVLLELKFENRRTDLMSLRRIRLTQRTSPTLNRAILPLEIAVLKKNQLSSAFLILSFSPSANASSLSARFDVKSDKGTTAIDIRPPLFEMLGRLKLKESEFDSVVNKLNAPHQKITSSMEWIARPNVSKRIEKYNNLTQVVSNKKSMKFVASIPHTKEIVCVLFETERSQVTVYCDNAIAANAVMEAVRSPIIGD